MPYLTSSKVVVKLSLNEWNQILSKSRPQKLSGSTFPKGLKNNGIFHTLWEQLTANTLEFKSRKMVAPFTTYNYKHTHSIILMAIADPGTKPLYYKVYKTDQSSFRMTKNCPMVKLPLTFFLGMMPLR